MLEGQNLQGIGLPGHGQGLVLNAASQPILVWCPTCLIWVHWYGSVQLAGAGLKTLGPSLYVLPFVIKEARPASSHQCKRAVPNAHTFYLPSACFKSANVALATASNRAKS